jgi:DNA-directed RNA polymerase specialized sigma24 family protein
MAATGAHHDEDLARRIYAYLIFRLRQPLEAERLTQLSFQRLWQEAAVGREIAGDPYLPTFAIARTVLAETPRSRGAVRFSPPTHAEGAPSGISNELAIALGRLHGRERDALALRFGGELSVGEIAELLDRTPADVKQRLARGIRGLIDLGVLPDEKPASAAKRPRARRPEQGEREQE